MSDLPFPSLSPTRAGDFQIPMKEHWKGLELCALGSPWDGQTSPGSADPEKPMHDPEGECVGRPLGWV